MKDFKISLKEATESLMMLNEAFNKNYEEERIGNMKKKMLGNEIPWYKPFKLVKRNKELELLNVTLYQSLNSATDEVRELKSRVDNRNKMIYKQENTIKNLENNIEVLSNSRLEVLKLLEEGKGNVISKNKIKEILGI